MVLNDDCSRRFQVGMTIARVFIVRRSIAVINGPILPTRCTSRSSTSKWCLELDEFTAAGLSLEHDLCTQSAEKNYPKMIHVIATIELAEGKRDEFLAEFHKIVRQVRAEDGCLDYGPTVDAETVLPNVEPRPDVVTVVERWEGTEELEAHLLAPHMIEYRKRVKDLVKSVQLQILEPVAAPAE